MTVMQAEESAELNRDSQLGQHNCLQGCVYLCACVRVSLLQSMTENGSDRETDRETESMVMRHWYNYAYCKINTKATENTYSTFIV